MPFMTLVKQMKIDQDIDEDLVITEWRQRHLATWIAKLEGHAPARHLLDTFPLTPPCQKFLETNTGEPRCGIFLHGEVGTGKTSQLVQMMKTLFIEHAQTMNADPMNWGYPALDDRNPPRAFYVTEINLLEMLRPGEHQKSINLFRDITWLFIDEVGRAKPTEWSSEQIYSIIDHRYGSMKPTAWASNYSMNVLAKSGNSNYDDRVMRRIFDMCGGVAASKNGTLNAFELKTNHSKLSK
jgi:DNA replication protein DnaC